MNNSHDQQRVVVDFVLRGDAFSKNGGDVVQAQSYADVLRELGDDVRLIEYAPGMELRENALIHYFNVDRPFEMLEVARAAGGRPFFVSTIHHSIIHVREMRRAQRTVNGRALASAIPEDLRTLLVFIARTVADSRGTLAQRLSAGYRAVIHTPRMRRSIRNVLEAASGIFLLSELERASLSEDYGLKSIVGTLTPNGRPSHSIANVSLEDDFESRQNDILVVGRIESRKRQLDIARQALQMELAVSFVGTPNLNESEYVHSFDKVVSQGANLRWIRGLPHDQVLEKMRSSKVLLNASWVEVQSLVDLEAVFSGCRVVTLENGGSSKEWLGGAVVESSGSSISDALRIANNLNMLERSPLAPTYTHSWESTTDAIRKEYLKAIGGGYRISEKSE